MAQVPQSDLPYLPTPQPERRKAVHYFVYTCLLKQSQLLKGIGDNCSTKTVLVLEALPFCFPSTGHSGKQLKGLWFSIAVHRDMKETRVSLLLSSCEEV